MIRVLGGRLRIARSVLGLCAVALALSAFAWLIHSEGGAVPAGALSAVIGTVVFAALLLQRQAIRRETVANALKIAEARVSNVVETAMDPMVVVDETQKVVLFNAAAERVFGWQRDEVIGKSLNVLIPQSARDVHPQHMQRFGMTGSTARRMGHHNVLAALRADGSQFPIEASISHHSENGRELYTAIVRDVTERVRIEESLRRSQRELQELALAAHETREEEQGRIARELHDELGQSITALKMMVASMQVAAQARDDKERARLGKMQVLLDETFASIRRMTSQLRPLILDDLGLAPALERLTEGFTERTGVDCALEIDAADLDLGDAEKTAVFRIVQESLTNIARHAEARQVYVRLTHADGELRITVSDDGVGFAADAPRKSESRGLIGIRERAHLLGGEMQIASAKGDGTRLDVRIPRSCATRRNAHHLGAR